MFRFHAAEKQPHDGDGEVSERCPQVRLDQHHEHGNPDQRSGLYDVLGLAVAFHVGEILGHRQNKDQLHPLGRLEVERSSDLHPAFRAQVLLSEDRYRQQGGDRDDVEHGNPLNQRLIADEAHAEHDCYSAQHPVNLLDVHTHELGVERRAINLHDAKSANQQHQRQQDPVEIAEGYVAAQGRLLGKIATAGGAKGLAAGFLAGTCPGVATAGDGVGRRSGCGGKV